MLTVYACGHVYNGNVPQPGDVLDVLRGRSFIAPDEDCPLCVEEYKALEERNRE